MFYLFEGLTRQGRLDRLVFEMHTAGWKVVDHMVVCALCHPEGSCDVPETQAIYQEAYNARLVGIQSHVPWSERLLSWLFHFSL